MRRLLQFGTVLLMITAFIVPLFELFDTWDGPGLANDTEYAVFALVLGICLVLLVCKLLASLALRFRFISCPVYTDASDARAVDDDRTFIFAVPPPLVLPLRI